MPREEQIAHATSAVTHRNDEHSVRALRMVRAVRRTLGLYHGRIVRRIASPARAGCPCGVELASPHARNRFRYAAGVRPVDWRKRRVKWDWSVKPASMAM